MTMNEMNITFAQYLTFSTEEKDGTVTTKTTSINATIDGVEMSVPLDPANRHYAAIMEQVEAGTLTIAEAS